MFPLQDADFVDALNAIKQSDLPEIDRLMRAFNMITSQIMTHFEHDIDLARALHDPNLLVKNQIKLEGIKSAREILEFCYRFMMSGSSNDV
ncbi:MAG: hypothetical protein JXN59_16375 [Anaerolineae bacterium]|nr:hypothetical protein [Anaerolineae bacterium]